MYDDVCVQVCVTSSVLKHASVCVCMCVFVGDVSSAGGWSVCAVAALGD